MEPEINMRIFLRQPEGPEPIDQHTEAIGFDGRLIDTLDQDLHRGG